MSKKEIFRLFGLFLFLMLAIALEKNLTQNFGVGFEIIAIGLGSALVYFLWKFLKKTEPNLEDLLKQRDSLYQENNLLALDSDKDSSEMIIANLMRIEELNEEIRFKS